MNYSGIGVFVAIMVLPYSLFAEPHGSSNGVHGSSSSGSSTPSQDVRFKDPNQVISFLLEGNERFVAGRSMHPRQTEKRRGETAVDGQKPFVTLLSCSDSRVPPEFIFDAGIGDLFIIRVAGNVADKHEIGSIEYGVGHVGTPLLVIMGHSKCGAVTATVKKAEVGSNIASLLLNIEPAVKAAKAANPRCDEETLVNKSIRFNVYQAMEDIFRQSAEVRMLVRKGKLKVVGFFYDIESGHVANIGVHYRQEQLLSSLDK